MGLPAYNPNYQQATNDFDNGIKNSLIEGDSEAGLRDYSISQPIPGYEVHLSGTPSETISNSIGELRGEDIS